MKKEQKEGIFVVSENTHHYNSAPSGTRYTFMKGRGLWINHPLDITFFKGKVERGSGFHIEKEAINIADKVKVVKKEDTEEKAPTEPLSKKIKEKLTGKKTPKEVKVKDPKAEAIIKAAEEKHKKALAVLEALDKKEAKAKEEQEVEEALPEEIAELVKQVNKEDEATEPEEGDE